MTRGRAHPKAICANWGPGRQMVGASFLVLSVAAQSQRIRWQFGLALAVKWLGPHFLCCRLQPSPREFGGNLGGNGQRTWRKSTTDRRLLDQLSLTLASNEQILA